MVYLKSFGYELASISFNDFAISSGRSITSK